MRAILRLSGVYAVVSLLALGTAQALDGNPQNTLKVDDHSFKCMQKMTAVRHFFVDNIAGHLDETVAVAKAGKGDYPVGSVVQLMPNEVMIKHEKGFNDATRDWEFFGSTSTRTARRSFAAASRRSATVSVSTASRPT